jgi:hypothetical protein
LVAIPFTWPQLLVLDRAHPGWEKSDLQWFDTITKRSAAAITALEGLVLLCVLRRLGLGRHAWVATTAAALGSNLWVTASQTLWQHGPAALMLTVLVWLLLENPWRARSLAPGRGPGGPGNEPGSRMRYFGAGLAAALLVCCRPIDLAFSVTTAVWVTLRHPRRLLWFVPPAVVIGALLIGYNRAYLGTATGRYSQFESGMFATPLEEGLKGTLVSPSRGLFIFSPWTVVALGYLPFALFRLRPATLLPWLLATLGAHALLISSYTEWWAGGSFGPRYWTEVIPLLAIVLGMALEWAAARCRPLYQVALALSATSIGVQMLGAAVYPSGWENIPTDINHSRERLWDWSDSELTRMVVVSKAYRAVFGSARAEAFKDADAEEAKQRGVPAVSPAAFGTLDRANCERIEGWAWDPGQPETRLAVDIYDGETLVATVIADQFRRDLLKNKKGDGEHSFVFDIPASIKDAKVHEIHAKIAGTRRDLNRSPQAIECPEP